MEGYRDVSKATHYGRQMDLELHGGDFGFEGQTRAEFLAAMASSLKFCHLRDFFETLPFSVTHLRVLLGTMEQSPNSPIYAHAMKHALHAMEERSEENDFRLRVSVRGYLTPDQISVVAASRPHLQIKFLNTHQMSHTMAHVQRELDRAEQLRLIPSDESVLDIGGNLISGILAGKEKWYYSVPLLDFRDGVRGSAATAFASKVKRGAVKLSDSAKIAWERYNANPDKIYIRERAETIVGLKVDWVYAQHSLYDIGLSNMAKILHNTGAKGCYGSIIMNEATLYQESGECAAVGGSFYRCGKNMEEIVFGFNGDPSFMYTHKFSEYSRYYYDTVINYNGDSYCYHVYDRSADTVKYSMFKLTSGRIYKPLPMDAYKFTGRSDWLRVKGPVVDADKRLRDADRVKVIEYYAPRETVMLTIERLKVEGGKTELPALISYLRSLDVRFVVNNVCIKAKNKIPHEVFEHLACVMHALVDYEIGIERQHIRDITDAMKARRDGALEFGYFSALVRGLSGTIRKCTSGAVNGLRDNLLKRFKAFEYLPEIEECTDLEKVMVHRVMNVDSIKPLPIVLDEYIPPQLSEDTESMRQYILTALSDESLSDVEKEELKCMLLDYPSEDDSSSPSSNCSSNDSDSGIISSADSSVDDVEFNYTEMIVSDEECVIDNSDSLASKLSEPVLHCVDGELVTHDYMDALSIDRPRIDSVLEYSVIQRTLHTEVIGEALYFWKQTSDSGVPSVDSIIRLIPNDMVAKLSVEDLQHNYLKVINGIVIEVLRPSVGVALDYSYMPMLDGTKRALRKSGSVVKASVDNGWYYVNNNFKIFNSKELELMATTQILDPTSFNSPPIKLINGVPGCGKTTYIKNLVNNYRLENSDKFVVLVAARKSCDETKLALTKDLSEFDPWRKVVEARVKTIDSYSLNSGVIKPEVLLVDEGRMVHSGQLYAVCSYMNPDRVEVLGDPMQVPYVNFTRMPMIYDEVVSDLVENKNDSYRLSVIGGCMSLHMYGGLIRVVGMKDNGKPYLGSVACIKINSIHDIPKASKVIYVCFYQWEKKTLIQAGFQNVHTVVEVQGGDFPHVNIVRLEPRARKGTIYSEERRVNSALTRSWNIINYYTMCDTDMLSTWIRVLDTPENRARVISEYDSIDNGIKIANSKLSYKLPDFRALAAKKGFSPVDY